MFKNYHLKSIVLSPQNGRIHEYWLDLTIPKLIYITKHVPNGSTQHCGSIKTSLNKKKIQLEMTYFEICCTYFRYHLKPWQGDIKIFTFFQRVYNW